MPTLLDALSPVNSTVYTVGTVLEVQADAGTVSLDWQGGITTGVPHLLSYTPTVGDKVQLLNAEPVGILVLGMTISSTRTAPATTRLAYIPANRSMTWTEACVQGNRSSGGGKVTEGMVSQGADVISVYSGAYVYPAGLVTLVTGEIITKAEMLISRVDAGDPYTTSPLLHELVVFDSLGKPVVINPTLAFAGRDLLPGEMCWQPLPALWANNIVSGLSKGITFSPSSAQQALTFSQYDAYTKVVTDDTSSLAGSLRLTIVQSNLASPPAPPVARFTATW